MRRRRQHVTDIHIIEITTSTRMRRTHPHPGPRNAINPRHSNQQGLICGTAVDPPFWFAFAARFTARIKPSGKPTYG